MNLNRRNAIKAVGIGLVAPLVPVSIKAASPREQYVYGRVMFPHRYSEGALIEEFDALEKDVIYSGLSWKWPSLDGLRLVRTHDWTTPHPERDEWVITFGATLIQSTFAALGDHQLRKQIFREWRKQLFQRLSTLDR